MQYRNVSSTALSLTVLLLLTGCAGHTISQSRIQIDEAEGAYELTVSASRLVLTFPKGDLLPERSSAGGATKNPRYFLFEDEKAEFYISGWFEPADRFSGVKENWESSIISWSKAGICAPMNVSFIKQGNWDVVAYDMRPKGQDCILPNLRAHLVKAGTWIELHLSLGSPFDGGRDRLMNFLNSIQVKAKDD